MGSTPLAADSDATALVGGAVQPGARRRDPRGGRSNPIHRHRCQVLRATCAGPHPARSTVDRGGRLPAGQLACVQAEPRRQLAPPALAQQLRQQRQLRLRAGRSPYGTRRSTAARGRSAPAAGAKRPTVSVRGVGSDRPPRAITPPDHRWQRRSEPRNTTLLLCPSGASRPAASQAPGGPIATSPVAIPAGGSIRRPKDSTTRATSCRPVSPSGPRGRAVMCCAGPATTSACPRCEGAGIQVSVHVETQAASRPPLGRMERSMATRAGRHQGAQREDSEASVRQRRTRVNRLYEGWSRRGSAGRALEEAASDTNKVRPLLWVGGPRPGAHGREDVGQSEQIGATAAR